MPRVVANAIGQAILEARVKYFAGGGSGNLTDVVQVRVGFDLYRQLQQARPEQLGSGWSRNEGGEPRVLGLTLRASPAVDRWGWQVWGVVASGRGHALR